MCVGIEAGMIAVWLKHNKVEVFPHNDYSRASEGSEVNVRNKV